jgi:hypothetical protein
MNKVPRGDSLMKKGQKYHNTVPLSSIRQLPKVQSRSIAGAEPFYQQTQDSGQENLEGNIFSQNKSSKAAVSFLKCFQQKKKTKTNSRIRVRLTENPKKYFLDQ